MGDHYFILANSTQKSIDFANLSLSRYYGYLPKINCHDRPISKNLILSIRICHILRLTTDNIVRVVAGVQIESRFDWLSESKVIGGIIVLVKTFTQTGYLQMLLDEISRVAVEQGKKLNRAFRNFESIDFQIKKNELWDDIDLVTDIDKEVENTIYSRLKARFPELGFYLEENGELNDEFQEYVCYIDPIDGTKHFTKGMPLFATSIGITCCGEPVLGVIYNPISGQLYAGAKGIPTSMNGKRLSVSKTKNLREAIIALDMATHKENWKTEKDWMNQKMVEFNLEALRIRLFSVGAIVTSLVAQGALDAYVSLWGHGSKPFDIAAGKALIKYSQGGKIVDLSISGLSTPRFVGGNEELVDQICEILLR